MKREEWEGMGVKGRGKRGGGQHRRMDEWGRYEEKMS